MDGSVHNLRAFHPLIRSVTTHLDFHVRLLVSRNAPPHSFTLSKMAASSTSNSSTQTISKRNVPKNFSDLLDLAIFSFSCQSGLRANHKIRGDPVLEGVSAFLGRLISCSSPETMTEFEEFSPGRLGNWRPGQSPTKELLGLISSRLKTLKKNGTIRENSKPVVPSVLVDKVERFCEEEDRVKARFYSKCWRCGTRCEFCLAKKKTFPKFGNFNVE